MAVQRIQPRRDTAANWTAANPTLAVGELGYETDTKKIKRGDGVTAWTSLAYSLTEATAAAAIDSHLGGDATNLVPAVSANASAIGNKVDTAAAGYVMPALPLTITTLQAAADSAATNGTRLVASGSITTSTTLTIACDADLGELTINYTGSGVAVRIGTTSGSVQRVTVRAPQVLASNKAATGWGEVAGTVGVELANLYSSQVTVPLVRGFESGLQFKGYGPSGTAYVNVLLGHLDNNKRNIVFTADATGYANQNTIIGGRCSHNSSEGTVVAGTRHVVMVSIANIVNNNSLVGTSLESPNTVEYHLDCYGQDNYLTFCRWENTGASPRVIWRANTKGNVIAYGFNIDQVAETVEAGSTQNEIISRVVRRFMGGNSVNPTLLLENPSSSNSPLAQGMQAGAWASGVSPDTGWVWRFTGIMLKGKQAADVEDRIRLDFTTGRIYVGPGGTTAPVTYFTGGVNGIVVNGGNLFFDTDNTRDIGSTSSLRPRYVRAATAVVTGSAATASRPSASTAGVGAMFYDTTLGKPIWSNGTTWRDATGTAV